MSGWRKLCFNGAWLLALTTLPPELEAQSRSFHGIYVGAEVGREDLIGGSFVDGIDFLAHDSRRVAGLVVGARYQSSLGIVIGIEGALGSTDGDLSLDDPANNLKISYTNDMQTSVGGTLGFATGPVLLFAYAFEVTRHFDVRVTRGGTTFTQEDEQGMLRYGVGAEVPAVHSLRFRFKLGRGRADFGDAQTNIDPEHPLQVSFGLTYQF